MYAYTEVPMSKKIRLDVLLVERGLQESRQKAQATIMSGLVFINGQRADKPGTPVAEDAAVEIRGSTLRYVSRGGLKLEKALRIWPIDLTTRFVRISGPRPAASPTVCFRTGREKYLPLMWAEDSLTGN